MIQRVTITPAENEKIYNLFHTHLAYMDILQYLTAKNTEHTALFDKKWDEAVQIDIQLDEEKRKIELKYKPEGEWDRFEFDFDKRQVVFMNDA